MSKRDSVSVWFELPATDFERACAFYDSIFDISLKREEMGPMQLGVFPYPDGDDSKSGCVFAGPTAPKPSLEGATIYLNCDGKLEIVLGRVPQAGGAAISPIVDLPEGMGRFVLIKDTEGNRVGLHAVN